MAFPGRTSPACNPTPNIDAKSLNGREDAVARLAIAIVPIG
jgi:hypothetical protein